MSELSREDAELLAGLREGLSQSDPVPFEVVEFAKAAYAWRDLDGDLAALEFDSIDEEVPSGVRSTTTFRMISFQAGQWMIDVEYDEATQQLRGAITPEARYTIELHTSGTYFITESDQAGRFVADGVSPGPLGMCLRFRDGGVVKTEWVVL